MNEKLLDLKSTYQQNELLILEMYRKKENLLEQLEKLKTEIKEANNHQAGLAREIQDMQTIIPSMQEL